MARTKRKRRDSHDFQTRIVKDVLNGIKPPEGVQLRECDLPFWKSITDARAEWTDIDLAQAAILARTHADIQIQSAELDEIEEPKTIEQKKDLKRKQAALEVLVKRTVYLSRAIQVHSVATVGKPEANLGKNISKAFAIKNAEVAFEDDDDLLARPTQQ